MKKLIPVLVAASFLALNSSAHAEPSRILATVGGAGVGVVGGCVTGAAAGVGLAAATNGRVGFQDGLFVGCAGGAVIGGVGLATSQVLAAEPSEADLNAEVNDNDQE